MSKNFAISSSILSSTAYKSSSLSEMITLRLPNGNCKISKVASFLYVCVTLLFYYTHTVVCAYRSVCIAGGGGDSPNSAVPYRRERTNQNTSPAHSPKSTRGNCRIILRRQFQADTPGKPRPKCVRCFLTHMLTSL